MTGIGSDRQKFLVGGDKSSNSTSFVQCDRSREVDRVECSHVVLQTMGGEKRGSIREPLAAQSDDCYYSHCYVVI